MKDWVKVDTKEFLTRKGSIRRQPHNFSRKVLSWMSCCTCGLLTLRNDPTKKAMKKMCEWEE